MVYRWQHCSYADPFWRVVGNEIGSINSLDCFWQRLGHEPGSAEVAKGCKARLKRFLSPHLTPEFKLCVSKLAKLESLSVLDMNINSAELHHVLDSFQSPSLLTHLDVSERIQGHCRPSTTLFKLLSTKFSRLRSLNLSTNELDVISIKALGPCIAQLPELSKLNINGCSMQHDDTMHLAQHLSRCNSLQELRFGGNECSVEFMRSVCACIDLRTLEVPDRIPDQTNRGRGDDHDDRMNETEIFLLQHVCKLAELQVLHLTYGAAVEHRMDQFSGCISSLTCLRELHLGLRVTINMTDSTGADIAAFVSAAPSLEVLAVKPQRRLLSENHGLHALAGFLDALHALRHVHLVYMGLFPAGVEVLASKLSCCPNLETLDLEGNIFGDTGAKALAEHLSCCLSLKNLNLAQNRLRNDAFRHLAEPIGMLSALQTLCLQQNSIGTAQEGLIALGEQFSKLKSLTKLDMSACVIGGDAAVILARFLADLKSLKSLVFHRTCFRDSGLSALAPVFGRLCSLQHLCLRANCITCEGATALCSNIQNISGLQCLDLRFNEIEDEGGRAVLKCVRGLPALTCLDLTGNPFAAKPELESCPYVALLLSREG